VEATRQFLTAFFDAGLWFDDLSPLHIVQAWREAGAEPWADRPLGSRSDKCKRCIWVAQRAFDKKGRVATNAEIVDRLVELIDTRMRKDPKLGR
jgi:hypothetical protein